MLNGGLARVAAVIIAAVLSLTAAGCGSANSRPDTQVPSPSPGRTSASPNHGTTGAPGPGPVFRAGTAPLTAVHQGELVVNSSAAASLTQAFRRLFAARFPIRRLARVPRHRLDLGRGTGAR